MRITRRQALLGAAAASVPLPHPTFAQTPTLVAAPGQVQLAPPGYPKTNIWSFGGTTPGETLRFPQGTRFSRRFENRLPTATTIHWHGLRVPNAMDGVPGFSQAPVPEGGTFDYSFELPDAGTYWYHPHMGAPEQLARGLSGAFIIDEIDPPDVDADHVLIFDDWRLGEDAQIDDSFENRHDLSHAGRLGNFVTVNGSDLTALAAKSGDRLRLRLINAATARVFTLDLQGLKGWVAALDGMPVVRPFGVTTLPLGPAQRVDLIVDVTAENGEDAFIISQEGQAGYAAVTVSVEGRHDGPRRPAPDPLPANTVPTADLGSAKTIPLQMGGGAMAWLQSARHQGETMDGRALAAKGQFWAFNGVAGMPEDPLVNAALGETIRIPITNDTRFSHVIHLHGHHFSVLNAAGELGPLRDSILLSPNSTREIAFVADNPGDWMLHCHMLSHQVSGMMSWIRVG